MKKIDYIKDMQHQIDAYKELGVRTDQKEKVRSIKHYVNNLYNGSDEHKYSVDFEIEKFIRDYCHIKTIYTVELDMETDIDFTIEETIREIYKSTLRYILNLETTI